MDPSPKDILALWARAGPGWTGPFDSSKYNGNFVISTREKEKVNVI
jgi:hypothetical protein